MNKKIIITVSSLITLIVIYLNSAQSRVENEIQDNKNSNVIDNVTTTDFETKVDETYSFKAKKNLAKLKQSNQSTSLVSIDSLTQEFALLEAIEKNSVTNDKTKKLLDLLAINNPALRSDTLMVLRTHGSHYAISHIIKYSTDKDLRVQRGIFETLGAIASRIDANSTSVALDNKELALNTLQEAYELSIRQNSSSSRGTSWIILEAISNVGNDQAAVYLLSILNDTNIDNLDTVAALVEFLANIKSSVYKNKFAKLIIAYNNLKKTATDSNLIESYDAILEILQQ